MHLDVTSAPCLDTFERCALMFPRTAPSHPLRAPEFRALHLDVSELYDRPTGLVESRLRKFLVILYRLAVGEGKRCEFLCTLRDECSVLLHVSWHSTSRSVCHCHSDHRRCRRDGQSEMMIRISAWYCHPNVRHRAGDNLLKKSRQI